MLTDTHIHLYNKEFDPDREQCIEQAVSAGVDRFFLPNIDLESIAPMLALEAAHPDRCFAMMGLHPCYVKEDWQEQLAVIESWWERRTFCAVGEIGIDLYWDKSTLALQEAAFSRQIQLANRYNKPVVIHCRESFNEIMAVLKKFPKQTPQGIFHCFSGNADQAREVIQLGFSLGIGGVVTYKKSGLDQVVKEIPLEHIVLETDAPYLAPVPFRGKRNAPEYVRIVAEQIATIKGITMEEVAAVTTENSRKIFGC